MCVTMCSTLNSACSDLSQLKPCEHGARTFPYRFQPAARTVYERSRNIERRNKVVTLEGRQSVRIKVRIGIIKGYYYGSRREPVLTVSHCFHKVCDRYRRIVTLVQVRQMFFKHLWWYNAWSEPWSSIFGNTMIHKNWYV